jgi:hypothetical protein
MQMFLKVNSSFWNLEVFWKAVQSYIAQKKKTVEQVEEEADADESLRLY